MPNSRGFEQTVMRVLLICFLILITYFNVFNADFVSDDIASIRDNPNIGSVSAIFARPIYFLYPLVRFISYSFGDLTPFSYRIFNILFHIGTSLSAYSLLAALSTGWYAFFVVALFAVHPLLTESVTWISAVAYPQSSFFLIAALLTYVQSQKKNKQYLYYLSLGLTLFAVLSSPIAFNLPIIFILYELSFGSIKSRWKKIIPYCVVTVIVGFLFTFEIGPRVAVLETIHSLKPQWNNPLEHIPFAITTYLQLIFFPKTLSFYHSELSIGITEFIIRCIIFTVYILSTIIAYKKSKMIFFWMTFFLIALSPTLIPFNIVMVIAERYAYLATLGILATCVYILFQFVKTSRQTVMLYSLLGFVVFTLMIRSIIRNHDWQNEDNLWIATVKTSPHSASAHNNMGDVYTRKGDYQSAIREFINATRLKPDYGDAYHNLAVSYTATKQYDRAIENYKLALKYNPRLYHAHQNLGVIYYMKGLYKEAKFELQKALDIGPANVQVSNLLKTIQNE